MIERRSTSCARIAALVAVAAATLVCPRWMMAEDEADVRYNRDVLPILADQCFVCHGFDKGNRKAGLRLDVREAATAQLKSGVHAIAPGKIGESALIERIFSTDVDEAMPPKK